MVHSAATMATAHPSLFDDDPLMAPTSSTLIVHTSARPRNKKEQTFNRLLAKVQALRIRLDAEKRRLDEALVFHAAEVRPRVQRAVSLRKDLVRTLTPFIDDRRLKVGDRRVLAAILADQLDDILLHDELPDQDLQELFERLNGVGFTEAAQAELEEMRSEMAAVLAEAGLDVEIPELRVDMSEEEMAATAAEMANRMQSAGARVAGTQRRRANKRDARADERRRRFEEMRKTGISAVYKRLAKALHPDLERDDDVRLRKGVLMQEVTAAYARHDLHTLLRLELEWIDREQGDAARLSEDTLDAYTELLKQQVAELEAELRGLLFHPRYESIVAEEGPFGGVVLIEGGAEVRRLDQVIERLSTGLKRMTAGRALSEVRGAIREYRQAQRSAKPY